MALHKTEVALEALRLMLETADTVACGRWYRGRTLDVEKNEVPCGLVRMADGQGGERMVRSDVNFFVTRLITALIVMKLRSVPEDVNRPSIESELNAFRLQVENAIQADPTLGGAAIDVNLTGYFTNLESANADYGDAVLVAEIQVRSLRTDAAAP